MKISAHRKSNLALQKSKSISVIICTCLMASFANPSYSAPPKKIDYKYVNRDGTQVVGNYNKVDVTYICAPVGWKGPSGGNSIIRGKFRTVNGNLLSKLRGVKIFEFNSNGTYKMYERNKATGKDTVRKSGVYVVGQDPWRKGDHKVAVLENAGKLWVRIDSKDRINYAQMNYDRIK